VLLVLSLCPTWGIVQDGITLEERGAPGGAAGTSVERAAHDHKRYREGYHRQNLAPERQRQHLDGSNGDSVGSLRQDSQWPAPAAFGDEP
jgi:hypothetical protein